MVHWQRMLNVVLSASVLIVSQTAAADGLDSSQSERIDALFADFNSKTPGCSLGVMSNDQMVYDRGYGMASLDPPAPIDSGKLFDIGSVSKQFTAASIVLLAQQGKLELTDDVRKYVPELPLYGTPITINHLLWHTSGLRDYVAMFLLGGHQLSEVTTKEQALDLVRRQPRLNFTPGTRYQYSNTGYFLLSVIAERVSGQSLNQLMRTQIFDPLSMPYAVFRDRHDREIPNPALGYAPTGTGFEVIRSNWEQTGAGGLQLSMNEALPWDENFYSGMIGGQEFLDEMHHTGTLSNGKKLIYARGVQVDRYRGVQRVRHGGDAVGYHANFVRIPDLHTTVALFCNAEGINQYRLSKDVIDIVLEREFPQPEPEYPGPAPSLSLDHFVGAYAGSGNNEVYNVTEKDGVLTLHYLFVPYQLISTGRTSFTIRDQPGSSVQFAVQGDAPARSVTFITDPEELDEEPRKGVRFIARPPSDLNAYAGAFHSPELGVSWRLAVQDGALTLQEDPQIVLPIAGPLSPANSRDTFHGAAGYLSFQRDRSGAIIGFKMSFLGMKEFLFERAPSADAAPTQGAAPGHRSASQDASLLFRTTSSAIVRTLETRQ